jgi:GNAT superfamily N-acetyltransferase
MIKKLDNTAENQKVLTQYLREVDKDFEIPLSNKTDLEIYAAKLLTHGIVLVSLDYGHFNGMLAGYCNDTNSGNATITILSVKKNSRGQGISHQLISKMIDSCRDAGMRKIYVDSVNPVAISSYLTSEFHIIKCESDDKRTKTFLQYII